MNKEKVLVIMAAGLGKRFGGLKQIEPIGPNQEFIIDYSIYDAYHAGFTKVILIIRKENYDIFVNTIEKRVNKRIKIEYVFQEENKTPGTSSAILCAKQKIKGPFVVINADDFYGRKAFEKMIAYMNEKTIEQNEYAMIGYFVKNTLTENGVVKRAVCKIENNELIDIMVSSIKEENGNIIAINKEKNRILEENTIVSMNMYLFTPTIFSYIESSMKNFEEENKEFLITDVLKDLISKKIVKMNLLEIASTWYGMTYWEDKKDVVKRVESMIEEGLYPKTLWEDYK